MSYKFGKLDILDININGSTINFYVATTGSDSNNGRTISTPFLTIEKALNSVPMLIPGVYAVNIADGTYTLSAEYEFKSIVARSGNTDNSTVVKVIGNITTPANVVIRAATSTTNLFKTKSKSLLVDFDGITFSTCNNGISVDGGLAILRAVNIDQYRGSAISVSNFGFLTTSTSALGGVLTSVASVASVGIQSSIGGNITISWPTLSITNFGGSGLAINPAIGGRIVTTGVSTLNITANATTGLNGISVGSYGSWQGGGNTRTINISNLAGANGAGVNIAQFGLATFNSNATVNFTNCQAGFRVLLNGILNAAAGTFTVGYTTTTVKAIIQEGAHVDTSALLSATGSIQYIPAVAAAPLFGYDNRYVRVGRPTTLRTAVADTNYTVLTTDAVVAYSTLSAARTITLPTLASATTDITAGQMRIFTVKDESGSCSTINTLTVSVSGGATIDGAASYVINLPYGSVSFYAVSGGTNYFTI